MIVTFLGCLWRQWFIFASEGYSDSDIPKYSHLYSDFILMSTLDIVNSVVGVMYIVHRACSGCSSHGKGILRVLSRIVDQQSRFCPIFCRIVLLQEQGNAVLRRTSGVINSSIAQKVITFSRF